VSRWFLFFSFPNWRFLPLNRAASVAILPFALVVSDISLGARWVFSFQWVLLPEYRPLLCSVGEKLGQDLVAVTRTRRSSSATRQNSSGCGAHRSVGVPQRFVHLSTYPQPMQ
jgi:hypothetical protein